MEHVSKKYGYLCLFTSYIKLFALYFAKCAWCSRNAKLSCSHLMLFISIATIGRVLWMFFDLMLYDYFMLSIATWIQLQSIDNHILPLPTINIGQWLWTTRQFHSYLLFHHLLKHLMSCLDNSFNFSIFTIL